MQEIDDPGCRQLAERRPVLVRDRDALTKDPAEQPSGGFRQIVSVGGLEALALDPIILGPQDLLTPRPAVGSEAEIFPVRLHDPGGDKLAECRQVAIPRRHPVAPDAEPEHGHGIGG
jgi:hypothetical protein